MEYEIYAVIEENIEELDCLINESKFVNDIRNNNLQLEPNTILETYCYNFLYNENNIIYACEVIYVIKNKQTKKKRIFKESVYTLKDNKSLKLHPLNFIRYRYNNISKKKEKVNMTIYYKYGNK